MGWLGVASAIVSYPAKVMTVYILGLFMTIIDGTMVNVALPTMAKDFGVPTTDIEWIAVGYLLTYAAVIPAAGWLGDRFGTKRVFTFALIAFVVTSLACGLSQTLDQLIVFRVLQGVGAGLVTPVGAAMLYRAYSMEDRAKAAIGVLSVAVIAPAIGPMLGGILVDTASWHWIFLINGPIGAVAIVLSLLWLEETKHEAPGRFDVAGFVLSAAVGRDPAVHAVDRPGEGMVLRLHSHVRRRRHRVPDRTDRDRAAHPQPDPDAAPVQGSAVPHINISAALTYAGFFGMIFVLAALPAEPARLHRVPEWARPVATGGRCVPRVEPARPAALPRRSARAA